MRILPQWLNQTFMGERATFGDDRSLTNFILRTHRVVFHDGARCVTYVPDTWSKFFRQQLRWKKSWSRETTVAVRQMYRMPWPAALSYYIGVVLTLLSPLVALRSLIFLFALGSKACIPYLAGVFLVYLFFSLLYFYHTGEKHWFYGLAFARYTFPFFHFRTITPSRPCAAITGALGEADPVCFVVWVGSIIFSSSDSEVSTVVDAVSLARAAYNVIGLKRRPEASVRRPSNFPRNSNPGMDFSVHHSGRRAIRMSPKPPSESIVCAKMIRVLPAGFSRAGSSSPKPLCARRQLIEQGRPIRRGGASIPRAFVS